ncbi:MULTISPECIES: nucleoside deaminase [Bacillus]|uniref:nucleoside deaminase n=1 Tax=Bacillus TaxID=1386 RepID=UPI0004088C8F|nr:MULTISPECIES: nucleoside deaminase [Bacillus]QHZ46512.1 nucleoside deaminase [Bacillus sp. NSP9.1]WFA06637.1 nucleoside deaminase [Bacillus sp. HSf4]
MNHEAFLQRAIDLAVESVESGTGGPFGAVIVKDGNIIAEGKNNVTTSNDPTAHAEVTAIRLACEAIGDYQLHDCVLYTSCEPCPMCLGAIYWARPKEVYFAARHSDAAQAGFDDTFIYDEIMKNRADRKIPFYQMELHAKLEPFQTWENTDDKIEY